jgi:radical SAM protein with 4Fe4S-binding SPASM domain
MKTEHTNEVYGIRPQAKEFPLMTVIGFSYVCNSHCPSCPYTNSSIRDDYKDALFMSKETFKIIADQCGHYNAWLRISGGGEPMLHPNAIELITYAKHAGAKIGLITNGSRFTEESSAELLKAQIDMIEFSVDAAGQTNYERVRKGLRWETLLENITRMVSLRNELNSNTKIIASGVNQEGVDIEAVAKYWEPIVDEFQKRKYLTWGINDPSKSADPTPYLPPEERIPCPFIFERLNIDSRGKVTVCGFDIVGRTNMGNIHEKKIKDIWLGDEFNFYREKHLNRKGAEIEMCNSCPDWKYRSWRHNYWKIVNTAEEVRKKRAQSLDIQDIEGCITETDEGEK